MNAPFRPEFADATVVAALPRARIALPSWPWTCLAVLAAIETVWLLATPLSLSAGTFARLAQLSVAIAAATLLVRRFPGRPRLYCLCAGGAFLLAAWPILRLFNHLTMTLPFPLADVPLAAADAALGFDWLGYVRWADSQPTLLKAMALSYGNLTQYSLLLFLLLVAGREPQRRCRELMVLFLATAVICSSVGAAMPALAAMAHYAPPAALFEHIGPATGNYHLELLQSLRSDPAHRLDLANLPGLVTFPSFHTAMGVVAIYCSRGTPWLLGPMLLVNLLMIAATPVFGSHYGIDVIAGAAVALGAIAVYRRASSQETPPLPLMPSWLAPPPAPAAQAE